MAEKFFLKDQLFNPETVARLGAEYASAIPTFDRAAFERAALDGFAERELLARLEWIADCLEPQLAHDFPTMADQLEQAMPPPLDPTLCDDDFGHFIHAVPGILAVRHGLDAHRERALDLLHAATQRFSMEFYIRPFLNRWPAETLARLRLWAQDDNYHVRRLVSEGTRPKLPWAKAVTLTTMERLPFLTALHADPTRFVTRSVANHLNDLAKTEPETVVSLLKDWAAAGRQAPKELAWMTRHALRTLIKDGDPGALALLGYRGDVPVTARLDLGAKTMAIGDVMEIAATLSCAENLPVVVDYRITFARAGGKTGEKVFKLKTATLKAEKTVTWAKKHTLKGDATTFTLHPGAHHVVLQVNGVDVAEAGFTLR